MAGGVPVAEGENPTATQQKSEQGEPGRKVVRTMLARKTSSAGARTRKSATRRMTARKRRLSARMRVLAYPPKKAICHVFGRDCAEAVAVARCESRLQTNAQNGQYLGMFQMGAWERRRFGHGESPYEQAKAAHRYYVLAGRDWSPWTCKPWW